MLSALFLLALSSPEMGLHYRLGFDKGEAVEVQLRRIPGTDPDGNEHLLQTEAADAFNDLIEAAARDGIYIAVNYSFRTNDQQKGLRHRSRRLAARPGFSDHQLGLSVDILNTRERVRRRRYKKLPAFFWLQQEAARFGFKNNVRKECWHWTYMPEDQS